MVDIPLTAKKKPDVPKAVIDLPIIVASFIIVFCLTLLCNGL